MKVFVGGAINSMEREQTAAHEALAFDRGRIVHVGRRDDVLAAAGPGAERIDLAGGALVPGFVDPHHHLSLAVFHEACVDVRPDVAPNIAAICARLSEEARRLPEGAWIVARGYDETLLAEQRHPTREDLDAACPGRAVLLYHYTCHEGIVSSKALELVGIDRSTPDPAGGVIARARDGQPTGRLVEIAFMRVEAIARRSRMVGREEELIARMGEHQRRAFAAGITRIVDPMVSPELEALYRVMRERGLLEIPLTMMPIGSEGFAVPPRDRLTGDSRTGDGPDDFRIGPMKLVFDGANRCAMCFTIGEMLSTSIRTLVRAIETGSLVGMRVALDADVRYRDGLMRTGVRYYTREEAREMIASAQANGFGVASHAIGNESVELVLDMYRDLAVKAVGDDPPRIEHAHAVDAELVRRIADQGIAVVTQPDFLRIPTMSEVTIPSRLKWLPVRSLIEAGVRVAGSSDAPVQPRFDPLLGIHAAITRTTHRGEPLHPEESIDARTAFALYTREAAYAAGCLATSGTLAPGKRADFVVLSADPFRAGADVAELSVRETFVAGRSMFRA